MGGRGKAIWSGLAALAVALGVLAAPAAAASPADWMYEPTTFTEIRLQIPRDSYEKLEEEPKGEYQPGTFSIAKTDGKPDSAGPFSEPLQVGVRLKGSLGSLRSIHEKAAFKIKFNSVVDGQTFLGLKKMTLNNMAQDPSMIHEAVIYDAFHAMGVPAPHVGFTYLTVNGKSYGLHLNIETQDEVSMEKLFGVPFLSPPQHVYEGEYGADVSRAILPGGSQERWKYFQVDEGKSKDLSDLEALLTAVEGTGGDFDERVKGLADLEEMTRMWVVEKFAGNWDGYAGLPADDLRPNNYYLYSDADGRFEMMPSGTDQTWSDDLPFGSGGGHLFELCLAAGSECRRLYEQAGRQLLSTLTVSYLDKDARCTAAAVNPWREYEALVSEPEKQPEYGLSSTFEAQRQMREFIAERPAELATFLDATLPPTEAPDESPCSSQQVGDEPSGGKEEREEEGGESSGTATTGAGSEAGAGGRESGAGGGAAAVGAAVDRAGAPGARFRLLRVNRSHRDLVVHLELPSAGVATVTGAVGRAQVCSGRRAAAGGEVRVRCRLSKAFLADPVRRQRRIHLVASFRQPPAQQPAARLGTHFRLRRG